MSTEHPMTDREGWLLTILMILVTYWLLTRIDWTKVPSL